ncbi:hypothetical protein CYMTET_7198 [Cymbomonas tetramitiformis]|uniref:Uncharacterized protein n=1 Tax=Cymbomonas tetramitiformis TaxID=36881 RepID=A0AAE0LHP7_9CHLO|nr:hypothetical protein CYMTET_7198 [Cymbomonas tetramitiformis]
MGRRVMLEGLPHVGAWELPAGFPEYTCVRGPTIPEKSPLASMLLAQSEYRIQLRAITSFTSNRAASLRWQFTDLEAFSLHVRLVRFRDWNNTARLHRLPWDPRHCRLLALTVALGIVAVMQVAVLQHRARWRVLALLFDPHVGRHRLASTEPRSRAFTWRLIVPHAHATHPVQANLADTRRQSSKLLGQHMHVRLTARISPIPGVLLGARPAAVICSKKLRQRFVGLDPLLDFSDEVTTIEIASNTAPAPSLRVEEGEEDASPQLSMLAFVPRTASMAAMEVEEGDDEFVESASLLSAVLEEREEVGNVNETKRGTAGRLRQTPHGSKGHGDPGGGQEARAGKREGGPGPLWVGSLARGRSAQTAVLTREEPKGGAEQGKAAVRRARSSQSGAPVLLLNFDSENETAADPRIAISDPKTPTITRFRNLPAMPRIAYSTQMFPGQRRFDRIAEPSAHRPERSKAPPTAPRNRWQNLVLRYRLQPEEKGKILHLLAAIWAPPWATAERGWRARPEPSKEKFQRDKACARRVAGFLTATQRTAAVDEARTEEGKTRVAGCGAWRARRWSGVLEEGREARNAGETRHNTHGLLEALRLPQCMVQDALPFHGSKLPRWKAAIESMRPRQTPKKPPSGDDVTEGGGPKPQPFSDVLGTTLVLAFLIQHRLVSRGGGKQCGGEQWGGPALEFVRKQLDIGNIERWDMNKNMDFLDYLGLMLSLLAWPKCWQAGDLDDFATWNLNYLMDAIGRLAPGRMLADTVYGVAAHLEAKLVTMMRKEEAPSSNHGYQVSADHPAAQGAHGDVEGSHLRGANEAVGNEDLFDLSPEVQNVWATMCGAAKCLRLPCACCLVTPSSSCDDYHRHCTRIVQRARSYVSEVSDKANTTVGAETHTKADAKTETDCRALVDSEHVASMWKAARGRQRMADALQQGMRASRPAGERFLGVRSRVLLGAALRRHPWAALLHVRPDAGPHQAARQVAALFGSWVAMLAAIATVNYYRGAALCTESRTLLGCDTLPTDYSLPFQSCMGAGSCEELYSSHLCGSHDTCHEEFQVKSGGEWWRATMTALVVCSIIPPLLRDLPMLAAPRLPCASRATAALSYAAGRGVCAICGALAAVLERCRWLAMALGTRWHFWRETQLRGRSPWSVFQELEAKEAVRSVKAASDHSILNIKQQPPHWTPAGVRLLCRANVGLEKKVREE